jgi:hypothetical protein
MSGLSGWRLREDLPDLLVGVYTQSKRYMIMHADPMCCRPPGSAPMEPTLPVSLARDLVRFLREHPGRDQDRNYGFCELCLMVGDGVAPGELSTYGNPLCPRCFTYHASDCP